MDNIIIGSGAAGCVVARQLAEKGNRKVHVIEKRGHIGGNCYDLYDKDGVFVHQYGPHIFHTNRENVIAFLSKFTDWHYFEHKVVARVGEQLLPVPFNLNSLAMIYEESKAEELERILIETYGEGSRVPIMKLKESSNPDIRRIAEYVYENIFLRYTMKQWGQTPEEISPEVTGRVPVLISHDNRYFQDTVQGVPQTGYTKMFEAMLDHENITVETNQDAGNVLEFKENQIYYQGERFKGNVIYTGALDELFRCEYGRLPYRSLRFEFQHYEQPDFQGHSVVNYTISQDYTRITEFKYLTGQDIDSTTVVREYPFAYTGKEGEIPYYAIINEENQILYEKYQKLAEKYDRLYLLGRLAEYKYYNIDAMVDRALLLSEKIMRGEK
ncbi:MAG: UDP-galactopyranose mutase [Lachnospiraceae bacterium]